MWRLLEMAKAEGGMGQCQRCGPRVVRGFELQPISVSTNRGCAKSLALMPELKS